MPVAISCVTIPVDDLQRATAFYSALGLSVDERDEDSASFDVDGVYLVLLSRAAFADYAEGAGQAAAAKGATEVIFSYFASSRGEVDSVLSAARGAGGTITDAEDDEGAYSGSFTDPDGHTWEVLFEGG